MNRAPLLHAFLLLTLASSIWAAQSIPNIPPSAGGGNPRPGDAAPPQVAIPQDCKVDPNETDTKKLKAVEKCIVKHAKKAEKLAQAVARLTVAQTQLAAVEARQSRLSTVTQDLVRGSSNVSESSGNACKPDSDEEKNNIRVRRVVLAPKDASDTFGRRIGKRFIVFQLTVENQDKQYQYMIHDMSIDLGSLLGASPGTFEYSSSTTELSILRGVPEKGQDYDPRNLTLHVLTGIGSVAGAVSGLTPFVDVFGSAVAGYNGPFISAIFSGIAPDHTASQLNRLSDSAYIANSVVGKQQSRVYAVFVPQSILLNQRQQKMFWKHPTNLFALLDLRTVGVCVDGAFVTEVSGISPQITAMTFTDAEQKKFETPNAQIAATMVGQNLSGGTLSLTVSSPSGITANISPTRVDTQAGFTLTITQPIAPKTIIAFTVTKDKMSGQFAFTVQYIPDPPTLANASMKGKVATGLNAGATAELTVSGTNLIPGDTTVQAFSQNWPIIAAADGMSATVEIHLPPDYDSAKTYTATLSSTTSHAISPPTNIQKQ
jgi:hypothetical protein